MEAFHLIQGDEVQPVFEAACQRRTKITMTVRYQNRWLSYNSRMLGVSGGKLTMDTPVSLEEVPYDQVLLAADVGLNFRLNSHRYFFSGKIARQDSSGTDSAAVLLVDVPDKLDRQDRRVLERVDVPAGVTARAAIWVSAERNPVWVGSVLNISVGGFQMKTSGSALNFFEPGDRVAVEMNFGPDESVTTEAHFRYGAKDGNMSLLGMEFTSLNLDTTPDAQANYQRIMRKLEEYRRAHE